MKTKSLLFLFSISALLFFTTGCTKIEGPGGAATIKGIVNVQEFDGANNLITTYSAQKFDVYIMYGEDLTKTYFDDDVETSFDGSFEFSFLEPGKYRLFFYEDHTFSEVTANNDLGNLDKTVFIDVEITDKKEVVDLGTMSSYKRF